MVAGVSSLFDAPSKARSPRKKTKEGGDSTVAKPLIKKPATGPSVALPVKRKGTAESGDQKGDEAKARLAQVRAAAPPP